MTAPAARSAEDAGAPRVLWLIPVALALHNVEEALTFPSYLPLVRERAPDVMRPIVEQLDAGDMRLALVYVTLIALLVVVWAVRQPRSPIARWCALAVQAVVALNVVSHVIVSMVELRGYVPGLVTAIAVNAPLSVHVFRRARDEEWIEPWSWWLLGPAAVLVHGPGLVGLLLLV